MANVIVTRNKVIQVNTPANVRPPNVVVAKKKDIKIGSDTTGYVDSRAGVILSNPTMSTRLDRLRDVDSTNEVEGATLVYDAAADKYVVSYIDLKYVKGSLTGGTF